MKLAYFGQLLFQEKKKMMIIINYDMQHKKKADYDHSHRRGREIHLLNFSRNDECNVCEKREVRVVIHSLCFSN